MSQNFSDSLRASALTEALKQAIGQLEALANDPANKSQIVPDIEGLRAELNYAETLAGVAAVVPTL